MGGQRLTSSQIVTLALLCLPHPIGSIGPTFWGEAGPAPGAQQPTRAGVQDPAGLAGWPLRWWQPPSLALAVTPGALGAGGVRHGSVPVGVANGSNLRVIGPAKKFVFDPDAMWPALFGHGQMRGVLGQLGVANGFYVAAAAMKLLANGFDGAKH